MNWLTEFVRPKIRTLFARREVPENLWHQCPACQQMIFHRDLMTNLRVCPHCSHHMRVGAGEGVAPPPRLAVLQDAPLIVFTASGGARMQEGAISLMQMPRTVIATRLVKEAGLPYIVVLTDPTTGGVTASFPMLGDIHIAEPGALIGFAGPRVIEQTVREKLPEGFQRAEYLLQHGMGDMVVHRHQLRATLSNLCRLLTKSPAPEVTSNLPVPAHA